MDPEHFRMYVVRPTLEYLEPEIPYSKSAENLLVGTAAHESRLKYLHQIQGPAKGVFQIEPATADDIWDNYLAFRPDLASKVRGLASQKFPVGKNEQLITNLAYATAMARLKYWRSPSSLPHDPDDVFGLAQLWKAVYNTELGAGTVDQFIAHYPEES